MEFHPDERIICRQPSSGESKTPVRSAEAIHLGDFFQGKILPVEESTDQFRAWEEAS
jgi:hypothetical protein